MIHRPLAVGDQRASKTFMKILSAIALGALALASSCNSPSPINNHWSADSIGPRAMRAFTGYEADDDGKWIDYQWQQKSTIHRTLRRHFLNWNAQNPAQPEYTNWNAPRPRNSLLPYPHYYVHFDLGFSSVLATLDEGGIREFFGGRMVTSFIHEK